MTLICSNSSTTVLPEPPRPTEYCAVALALACASLAMAPAGDAASRAQCVCGVVAILMGMAAERSRSLTASAIWELLASVSLLASSSAALTQVILTLPSVTGVSGLGIAGIAGAFAMAAALFGASRALHRLGARMT